MAVEDEILSEIEARDTTIMMKDKVIEQKNKDIEQKDKTIEQLIEQKDSLLRGMVRNLADKGISVADIASIVSISESEVEKLL